MKHIIIVAACTVLLSGCAFTPQQATLNPTLNVTSTEDGKNCSVSVRVIDERPSKSLGRKGSGYGPAGEITSSNDIVVVVQKKLTDALQKKGFVTKDYSEARDPRFTVEIRLLEYSTSTGFWSGGVHVKSAVKAKASRAGHSFEKMYRGEKNEQVVVVPGDDKNEDLINESLSDVLTQVVEDKTLIMFLVGN
jgi:uncharacterized lipoprotein YajG